MKSKYQFPILIAFYFVIDPKFYKKQGCNILYGMPYFERLSGSRIKK